MHRPQTVENQTKEKSKNKGHRILWPRGPRKIPGAPAPGHMTACYRRFPVNGAQKAQYPLTRTFAQNASERSNFPKKGGLRQVRHPPPQGNKPRRRLFTCGPLCARPSVAGIVPSRTRGSLPRSPSAWVSSALSVRVGLFRAVRPRWSLPRGLFRTFRPHTL